MLSRRLSPFTLQLRYPQTITCKRHTSSNVINSDYSVHIRRKVPQQTKIVSVHEALDSIRSNQRLYVQGQAGTPNHLLLHLLSRHSSLKNVEVLSTTLDTPFPLFTPPYSSSFRSHSFFLSESTRRAVYNNDGDYTPVFLSEIPSLMRKNILPINVALIHVSPPDIHGFCSLGPYVVDARAAVEVADVIIAQVNDQIPRTFGDGVLHQSMIDYMVEWNEPLPEYARSKFTKAEKRVGEFVATLVRDGSTLQIGVGRIPEAALLAMTNHRDLGVHTEMLSDGVVDLMKKGAITGMRKKVIPGKIVASFAKGTKALYDFIDDNPSISFMDCAFTNNSNIISENPQVVAINSAIEIDLTGQVCADSIGTQMYSGIGGQMDFMRGAAQSRHGMPIIAITSTTASGESRIVPTLKEGAGVTATRAHIHYVVTEHGIVNLFGKNLRQRAKALISIAHEDHREMLTNAAYQRFGSL